jgi:hypothetical protein
LIDSGTIDDINGRYHERVTIAVMFCDKTEFDFNALENEEIIDRMKLKAYKWMQSLRMSNALHVVSVNNTQRLYDNTTDILTGFAVNITIEDVAGVGECELPEVVIDVDKNGSYDVVGVDKVRVNVVPKLEEIEVTQNGEYLPPTDIAGFSKVNVDVQPVLEELTITTNGTYTPQEGVDGFSKVTAEFDTSSLPKVKISTFKVYGNIKEEIWDDYGFIDWEFIVNMSYSFNSTPFTKIKIKNFNTVNCTTFNSCFRDCSLLQEVSPLKIDSATDISLMFYGCSSLSTLDTSNWNFNPSINVLDGVFSGCLSLRTIDARVWDWSNLIGSVNVFANCFKLSSLIGGETIESVLANNTSALNGLNIGFPLNTTNLDRASLRAVINGVADRTGQTAKTLTLGATLMAKLTEEDIAIATNKNWTIA